MRPRTFFEKVWEDHVIERLAGGWDLLHIDRHLLHDMSGAEGLSAIEARRLQPATPELAFATPDHVVSTRTGRTGASFPAGEPGWRTLQRRSRESGIRFFDLGEDGQGIVHVMGPELGITLPGTTLVCGDSHTCTHGALGALAFGVGASEVAHVLATQVLLLRRPEPMRVRFDGDLGFGITAKDMALHMIGRLGAGAGNGRAVEYAGTAVQALSIEERLTLCNLSIEMGAKIGMVAPDDRTFDYVRGRPFAPRDQYWDQAVAVWRALATDESAHFDLDESIDAASIAPMVTWGTSPEQVVAVDGPVPLPQSFEDAVKRRACEAALTYMGLTPGRPIAGTPIDWVFIGSCTNSRLSDLRAAAVIARKGKVAPGVTAWVVPGSERVKRQAEAEGLHEIFLEAGFQWREPGCSLCVAANGERVPPGARAVSTSNRNFVGRQGPGARTHLASPAMAAAAALAGAIVDVRRFVA